MKGMHMKGKQHRSVAGPIRAALLGIGLLLAGTLSAQALDFNDVQNLIQHQAPENVIIPMIQQDPNLTITQEQANQLRAMGASENIIYALRVYGGTPAVQPTQVTTYPADGGSAIYQTTDGYYPDDGYGYSDSDYEYLDDDYDDFEGEYYQQYDGGTTIHYDGTNYIDPNIYQQPQIVVQPSPTVIYESPTYVYPQPAVVIGGHVGRRPPPPPPMYRPPITHHRPPAYRPPSHSRPGYGKPPPPRPGGSKPPPAPGGGKKPPTDHGKPPSGSSHGRR